MLPMLSENFLRFLLKLFGADFIGTEHYGFTFTVQEGIDAISDVIFHLETYDVTTIRAGTPMFLLARKIKAMGVKMVMSGEGADETLAGYLYFHKAPDGTELHEECVRKVLDLHTYDCLRANKATMAHGLEIRVPFLDKDMLDATMSAAGEHKMVRKGAETQHLEKWLLRKAFVTKRANSWGKYTVRLSDHLRRQTVSSISEQISDHLRLPTPSKGETKLSRGLAGEAALTHPKGQLGTADQRGPFRQGAPARERRRADACHSI